ncbi:hypothetical protein evm_011581 [Chilo suppressalis]|nr:hypothetical protein evm_011581 [Chilo suppressalis]
MDYPSTSVFVESFTLEEIKIISTMKFAIVLAVALVSVVAEETYSTENDNFDLGAVLADVEKLRPFSGCFLDKNPCDDLTSAFKKDIPEAVQQACAKCNDRQKQLMKQYLEGIKEKLPQDYVDFKKKYDPENKYFENLNKAVGIA